MSKDNYFDERLKRISQKLAILIDRPNFQQDIKELRRKWNIPEDGLKTEEANQEWIYWLDGQTDQYVGVLPR